MVKISSPFKEYFSHIRKTHNLGPDNFFHPRDPRQKFDLLILEMPKQKPDKPRASYFTFIEFYFMLKYFRLHRKSSTQPANVKPEDFHKNFKSLGEFIAEQNILEEIRDNWVMVYKVILQILIRPFDAHIYKEFINGFINYEKGQFFMDL